MKANPYVSGVTIRIAMANLHRPDEWWVTREGRRVMVDQMSETHVRNAFRMVLRRKREARQETLKRAHDLLRDAELAMLELL